MACRRTFRILTSSQQSGIMTKAHRVEEVQFHSFLTLSTRRRQGVNFTPQPLDPLGKNTGVHRFWGWMGPRADPDVLKETKNMATAWIWTADCSYHSLVTKHVGFLCSFRKMPGWYLSKATITPASFQIPSNLSVYPAVLRCTISHHHKIQTKMYILLLCPLHSSLSLAWLISCTKFYVVNRRQDIQKEGVISPRISS